MSLIERLERQKNDNKSEASTQQKTEQAAISLEASDPNFEIKSKVHRNIIEIINKRVLDGRGSIEDKKELMDMIENLVDQEDTDMPRVERLMLAREIYDEVAGLGPLEPLLADSEITEIMVNGPKSVYIEKKGKILESSVKFRDDKHVMHIINRIVSPIGRRVDESSPMVDARLKDGSRVNAIIPPISLVGPTLTIRKFSKDPITSKNLLQFGTASSFMLAFLDACVRGKLNIIVSGGTGSGKTTFLNVLSGYIPENERIITIEDAAELQLKQKHVITLESRPANTEGTGSITIRDLVRNSLRMRPDRIIVGEVRSGEALDMLQAMNTGHDGSIATGHANSPRELMARLETMVLMAGMELPLKAIREQISSALDLIVHQERMRDGSRKVTNITEVVGMEGDIITLQEIFVYKQTGVDSQGNIKGSFKATGVVPSFMEKLIGNGILVKDDWFMN
ncbi:MAG: CpaF family protein [Proteocatella sp.]